MTRERKGEAYARELRDAISSWLALLLALLALGGVFGAPLLVSLLAPGFASEPAKLDTAAKLVRITFPYIMLISLAAFGGAVLNSYGRFFPFAFAPALLNLSMIGATLFFAPFFAAPIEALAWGVIAGGGAQLLWMAAALVRAGQLPRLRWPRASAEVRRVGKLTLQGAAGVSVAQLNIVIGLVFASFLAEGSVSWLYFADRLMELPAGMLGAALAIVALPTLSHLASAGDSVGFSETLDWGLRVAAVFAVPAAAGLAVLAVPICATLFQHGGFTAEDTRKTAVAALAYSVGIPGLAAVRLLAAGFNARLDVITPVKVSAATLLVTVALYFALVPLLAHAGLALAVGLGASANALALLLLLLKSGKYRPRAGLWGPTALRVICACAAMTAVLWLIRGENHLWLTGTLAFRAGMLALCVTAGAAVYFAVLRLLGFDLRKLRRPQ